MAITRHYTISKTGFHTHYRTSGKGFPVLMLHPSPFSSAMMEGLMQVIGEQVQLIALDTPGYGNSDSLNPEELASTDGLSPYVSWLDRVTTDLNRSKFGIYGSATGAQIAIEYAHAHPECVEFCILDNAAHFEPEEREEIIGNYFPDISPQSNGSHLELVWKMSDGLFRWFPWYKTDEEHKISESEPDPQIVNATALAYLVAGNDYHQAYARAFRNEDARRIQRLIVPVHVVLWEGSILQKYSSRIDEFNWKKNVHLHHCQGGQEERFNEIKSVIESYSSHS